VLTRVVAYVARFVIIRRKRWCGFVVAWPRTSSAILWNSLWLFVMPEPLAAPLLSYEFNLIKFEAYRNPVDLSNSI
jgi:cell shape-determining protein MreD